MRVIGKAGKVTCFALHCTIVKVLQVIRLVRVMRIMRVFKLVRHFAGLQSLASLHCKQNLHSTHLPYIQGHALAVLFQPSTKTFI